jgi:hypothetical protein
LPHSAVSLSFKSFLHSSSPRFSVADVNTTLYPSGVYIEMILSCASCSSPKSYLLKHKITGIL